LKLRLARPEEQNLPLEEWATDENLGIQGFKYEETPSFYPMVYERRFREYPEEGYACLEDLMSGMDPSPGYSILAEALSGTRHSAVITTNFDNLVADALLIYSDTFPFVCGHESLASFVRVAMRRPLVCKIHRDLLLGPKNDPRSLKRLHEAWAAALRALLEHYTPIFIGYGGNDDSLMDLLGSLEEGEIRGQMLWCYYEESAPGDRIKELVSHHRGVLVPVPDFDLLMVLLEDRMGIKPLHATISERAEKRTKTYRDRILALDIAKHSWAAKPLAAVFERAGGWWAWELKARSETDPARRETIYRQGAEACPKSHELRCNFANFLTDVRQDHNEAEKLYRKAQELAPKNATITGNFARFMWKVRQKHDKAEQLFRKALQLDSKHANNTGDFGGLLVAKGQTEEAGSVLHRAGELNDGEFNQLAAEIALYRAILVRSEGRDDTAELDRLAELLERGFARERWSFDDVLEFGRQHLSVEDRILYGETM